MTDKTSFINKTYVEVVFLGILYSIPFIIINRLTKQVLR